MASSFQTLDNIYTIIRSISNKDTTTLTDATLLSFANKYYLQIVRELIALNEEFYAEISSADLVADQREYPLPIDDTTTPFGGGLIKIQRVEISYDNSNWYVAEHIPFSGITTPTILDADINNAYSRTSPKYYIKDRSVWLIPTPDSADDVTASNAGLRIFWVKRPGELTVKTDIPDLPKDWLSVLQEGMLYDVFRKFNRTADARDALVNWQIGISRMKELGQDYDTEQNYNLQIINKNYH